MPAVFITGAARGIGRATVKRMAAAGWDVYAGVRSESDAEAIAADRVTPVIVDVTDSAQIQALDGVLPARLDALVNNAGIAVGGPIEGLAVDELRRQLEVNVVGQVAVTQAALGRLRESRGRVVFISSVSGRVSTPMLGAYTASKFAIEAIADALRIELRSWGVHVVLVEPGSIDTDIWRNAQDTADATEAALSDEHRKLYAGHIDGLRKAIPRIQKQALPVDKVTAAVEKALTAKRPKARYLVGSDARMQLALTSALPDRASDAVLAKVLGIPGEA